MLSKPCGELYCHALAYCDMCGRLPFSSEYKLKVSGPQGAGAALCVLCGEKAHFNRLLNGSGSGLVQVVSIY